MITFDGVMVSRPIAGALLKPPRRPVQKRKHDEQPEAGLGDPERQEGECDEQADRLESRMRGNTHVRFGGAGRGNGPSERTTLRPGPIPTGGHLCMSCSRVMLVTPALRPTLR